MWKRDKSSKTPYVVRAMVKDPDVYMPTLYEVERDLTPSVRELIATGGVARAIQRGAEKKRAWASDIAQILAGAALPTLSQEHHPQPPET